jgi:hypothetical protein
MTYLKGRERFHGSLDGGDEDAESGLFGLGKCESLRVVKSLGVGHSVTGDLRGGVAAAVNFFL